MVPAVRPVRADPTSLRLVAQLNALSQLTEMLAFRVVELEEKLAATEQMLESVSAPVPCETTELRLEETDERISRLETLLHGAGALAPALHPAGGARMKTSLEPPSLDDSELFIEEGEQAFMDELAA
jgi:hypothetical protein